VHLLEAQDPLRFEPERSDALVAARLHQRVPHVAGEAFLGDAPALLRELDGAVATARRIDAGQTGRLRIGFVGSALLSIVPGTVERFRASRPGVAIELRERSTVDQLRAVSAGAGLPRPPDRGAGRHRGPRVIQYAPEMLTIIGLVAAGSGVSLVRAFVAEAIA